MSIIDELINDSQSKNMDENVLGALAENVNLLKKKQAEIESTEELLKQLKEEERALSQDKIPSMMDNLGFEKITLADGSKLSIRELVQCAIPAPRRQEAYAWLSKNGHGDLIKIDITEKFGRGEKEQAIAVLNQLRSMGLNPQMKEGVHAQTLKAWARTELEAGRDLPADLFKVHVVKQTKIA